MYRITTLSTRKDLTSKAAELAHGEWYVKRKIPLDVVILEYQRRSNTGTLPITIIATCTGNNGELAGMVTLKKTELRQWQYIGPWLSALYVAEIHRKNGIGRKLIAAACRYASAMGFSRLYLFIDPKNFNRLKRFYTRQGWIYLDSAVDEDGQDTEIFFRELKALPQINTDGINR